MGYPLQVYDIFGTFWCRGHRSKTPCFMGGSNVAHREAHCHLPGHSQQVWPCLCGGLTGSMFYSLLTWDFGWGGVGAITYKYTLNRDECVLESIEIYTWRIMDHAASWNSWRHRCNMLRPGSWVEIRWAGVGWAAFHLSSYFTVSNQIPILSIILVYKVSP